MHEMSVLGLGGFGPDSGSDRLLLCSGRCMVWIIFRLVSPGLTIHAGVLSSSEVLNIGVHKGMVLLLKPGFCSSCLQPEGYINFGKSSSK